MTVLYALTLGLSAALLFAAQPMVAKAVLPLLGGAPAVWTTCMVFFQAVLLGGYLYAHAATRRLGIRAQAALHAALLIGAFGLLPLGVDEASALSLGPGSSPVRWLLEQLVVSAALPFLAVAATAPLLQRWFAGAGHGASGDPYFLYAASNLGSLAALLAYPLLIEPRLPLAAQERWWTLGYAALGFLTMACAWTRLWAGPVPLGAAAGSEPPSQHEPSIWLRWVFLAFVPSSLMLGVTSYLSTDIAPMPLLWVVPLALYLLSFVLAFARRPIVPRGWAARGVPAGVMVLALVLGLGLVQPFLVPLHLLTFFLAALACHEALARSRPGAAGLTAFYLAIALGGALGGAFNALVAPVLFDRLAEYPLALVLACLAASASGVLRLPANRRTWAAELAIPAAVLVLAGAAVVDYRGWSRSAAGSLGVMLASGLLALACWTHRRRPLRFALTVGAALLASGLSAGVNGRVLHQERDFFGVLQVTVDPSSQSHRLFHGRTLHGQQSLDPALRHEPLSYFARSGPIGDVFRAFQARPANGSQTQVAVVGLGAGSLACYARPSERWTFYEIDPAVARIAADRRYFTFLSDARAGSLKVVLGDARLRLRDAPPHGYGLIVLDAFSSDAIPVHLLTREALRLDREKLAADGILALHISNRYIDLEPVLGALAEDAGLVCRVRRDLELSPAEARAGKQRSIWAVMAARPADFGPLADDPRWQPARRQAGLAVWRDDFSDLARHVVLWPLAVGSRR